MVVADVKKMVVLKSAADVKDWAMGQDCGMLRNATGFNLVQLHKLWLQLRIPFNLIVLP